MIKPSSSLLQTHTRQSALDPQGLVARLEPQVEPLLQRYPFISKLSGGGVVVRVLKTPPTQRPLWGRFFGDSFHLVRIPRGEDLTPWAPIMHGTIHPHEGGSRVELELRPHPSARTLSGVYAFFGLLLLVAAGLAAAEQPDMAGLGLAFGLLMLFFPSYRARRSFEVGCGLALESLDAAIGPQSEDASSTISSGSDQRA